MESTFERNYSLEVGDVVLIEAGGWGFVDEDENKYVEVEGFGDYFGEPGVKVKPYQCVLETSKGCGSIGDQGVIGYESFGPAPMILLNTKEGDEDTLVGKDFQVMGQGDVYKIHALDELHYNVTISGEEVCAESGRHRKSDVIGRFGDGVWVMVENKKETTFNPSLETRKNNKNQMELVDTGFPNALLMLGEVMTWAAKNKGYLPNDWKEIPNPQMSLLGAASRHRNKRLKGEEFDDESGLPHLAHEAFNVMAQLELLIMGKL